MRQLTSKQKKVIDNWIVKQVNTSDMRFLQDSVFTRGRHRLSIDDLSTDIWEELEKINDTEILHQEADRYISDRVSDIVHKT